ncbi:hypothetical protein BJ170DRAFT_722726 [Xylariales sp. AK1849]|nr:hypothetical protein BJ170DRAFT_722726 [Xylariales sp. AK1849]
MADPLSLLATAAGLVSLGLQLYGNFAEYLDGVKCSQNEIASATQRLMGMHDALRIVEATLPRLQAVEQTSQVTVMQCIRSCDSQMASLKTLLDDFGVHPSPNGFRAHLDEQKKKLRYPYRRDHIRRLEERIDSVTGTLSIAIQGLGLDFAAKQSQIADSQFTLITKHLDELNSSIAKQEAIMMELQSNIDTTVHRLVTKPAYFRDVCDNLLSTKAPTKRSYDTSMGGFGICTCTLRRRARRLGLSLPLWFGAYLESSKSSTHRSDCPMAVLNDVKVRQEVGVWTTLASRSISISLTFSINSSFGAGGISISPSLRTCRVVDEMTSPIFQLLYWTGRNSDILFASASEARQYLQTSITRLFHERQFLPTDLSYNGTSILDVLSPFFLFRDVAKLDGYLDVAGMLSRFGTGNGSDRFR